MKEQLEVRRSYKRGKLAAERGTLVITVLYCIYVEYGLSVHKSTYPLWSIDVSITQKTREPDQDPFREEYRVT